MSMTRSLEHRPTALPQARTPMLGRDREVAELRRLLGEERARLVTLVGPGGVGKTRLALHLVTDPADDLAGDVAFVSLASIREPRLVLLAIGGALGFAGDPDDGYEAALTDLLRDRQALLVLDNLEQVLEVVPAIGRLLDAAPGLVILATSQVALGVPGERVYPLGPLPTLDPDAVPVDALVALDAVTLYMRRAREIDPTFPGEDDPVTAVDVARICHRLDGLPLAIELAAARANVMSPRTMLARLENRMTALGEHRGDVPDRLRTMRAAIGWSHELLALEEQALFRRLAVFAGGWSVNAASQVFPEGGERTPAMLERLLHRSLVHLAAPVLGERRYTMLQTLADFGLDELARHGEEDAARLAHARFIVRLAEDAEPHLTGGEQRAWLDRLDAETDNLRAAVAWALDRDRADLVLRAVGALWRYLALRGLVTDARRWLDRALATRDPAAMPYRVRALIGAGYLAEDRRDLSAAREHFEQALHLAMAVGDRRAEGQALIGLGTVAHDGGDYETALGYHRRSAELARERGDRRGLAVASSNLGVVSYFRGQLEESLRYCTDGYEILAELGDMASAASSVNNMSAIAAELGEFALSEQHARRALELHRQLNSRRDIPSTLINLGEACRQQGKHAEAREAFAEAIRLSREDDDGNMVALALHGAAVLAFVEHDVRTAASQLLESTELLRPHDDPHSMIENAHLVALLCLETDRFEEAATIMAANLHLSERHGIGLVEPRQRKVAEMTATARSALGDERCETARAAGQAMDIETLTRRIEAACRAIIGPRQAPVGVTLPGEASASGGATEHDLTAREMEILRLLAVGKSTAEIAEELYVSARTVTTHVAHILEKLDVPNRTAAVAYAMREGLVEG